MGARAGEQAVGDRRERLIAARLQHAFRPVEAELTPLAVEHFDQPVGQQRKEVAGQTVNRR